jgi:hypothetical protein
LHPALEQDAISRQKGTSTESVELFLRVNMVFLSQAWKALEGKQQKQDSKITRVAFGHD